MKKRLHGPTIGLLAVFSLVAGAAAAESGPSSSAQGDPRVESAAKKIRLEDSTVIIEVNDTEGDAGLQFFLDGEPWRRMKVFRPGGKKVLDLKGTGRLRNLSLIHI